ncbi:tachylectin-related carbohydrate-binding protein [Lentzea sp. NPDC042327]|uniref:tachylectin-related carbohydrate-binding protein n=1 Tax=Lentzea sp. NPDC042327 TaxID=3154801 RepID=UPI0033D35C35
MNFRRFALPAVVATAVAVLPAAVTAPTAAAVDSFTCKTTAPIFEARTGGGLHIHYHEEPETGQNVWGNNAGIGNGWPASTYAGPGGKVYYINSAGEVHQQIWLGTGWDKNGESTKIDTSDSWKIYNTDPAYRQRLTIDARGDFYYVDAAGALRMKRYNQTSNSWAEWYLDGGWNQYDAIVAAGEGVLWARTPAGDVYRFRYHAPSQRWVSRSGKLATGWNAHSTLFSPGGDIVYGIHAQYRTVWWYRWIDSEQRFATGSGAQPAGTNWAADSATTTAAPDTCAVTGVTNPAIPAAASEPTAKPSLLRSTTTGNLHYSYVDNAKSLVHGEITDLSGTTPNGFETRTGYSSFTGALTTGENENGMIRVYGPGTDSNVHGFLRNSPGVWNPHADFGGYMVSAPQFVRTANKIQTMVAIDSSGALWLRQQRVLNGGFPSWRRPGGAAPVAPGSKDFTAYAQGDTIVLVVRNADGRQCKAGITDLVQTAWQCTTTNGFTSAAAVVALPNNVVQLFARKSDGTVHTVQTTSSGTIPDTWTAVPGSLPSGVTAVGAPSALLAPQGTVQLAVRGDDGFVYRTGQVASAGTAWHPWTEVTNYADETVVDPAVSPAGDTWVIAFRTPGGVPKLLRWVAAASAAARSATATDGAGEFVDVPLQG